MEKRILVVDDSALMRRVASDIINSDSRYHVEGTASDGREALELIKKNKYDAVILDVNMPKMNGLELLRELNRQNINVRVMMFSSTTAEGAKETLEALDLGAIDFIKKPDGLAEVKGESFKEKFLQMLAVVSGASLVGTPMGERKAASPIANKDRTIGGRKPTEISKLDVSKFQLKSKIFNEPKESRTSGTSSSESRTFGKGGFTVRDPIDKEIVLRKTTRKVSGITIFSDSFLR
jgi:two-component system chemotaxis response regulator CheB